MNDPAYPLQTLFWECTLRCNARCSFCGSRCGETPSQELTTQQILAAFQDVANKMDATQIMINVTGGEPLLRSDLFEVMRQCTAMGFSWGMVTNGMRITPQVAAEMKAAGMRTISISLDGLQEIHEALRGVPGSFPKIIQGIRMLKEEAFLEQLQVTTVVSRKNIHQLEDMYPLLKTLGLDSWRVAMVDPIGRAREHEELLLGPQELQTYLRFVTAHKEDSELPVITSCSHYLGNAQLGRHHFVCNAGQTVASILANGDIFVCPNVPRKPELIQGNVLRDSLPEIWANGFQWFRDPDARKTGSCSTCPHWCHCRGDSVHTWDFENHAPFFCYNRFFPEAEKAPLPSLSDLMGKLKHDIPHLQAIRVRYGWEPALPVIFTPNAARELHHYFHWGQKHPQNMSELLAALIGRRLSDGVLVEFVSPAYLEMRNTREARFTDVSLRSGIAEADAINETYFQCPSMCLADTPCTLLGFVHSHPDDLELFLSVADVELHQLLTQQDRMLSMILNPQKRQIAAYWGQDMSLTEVQLLMDESEVPLWDMKA